MILSGCQGIRTVNSDMEDAQLGCENEKATAIFWVDRNGDEKLTKYGAISTVKVHVNVYSDGTFRILSFCKQQKPEVVRYLEKRAAVFTIPQERMPCVRELRADLMRAPCLQGDLYQGHLAVLRQRTVAQSCLFDPVSRRFDHKRLVFCLVVVQKIGHGTLGWRKYAVHDC